MQYNTLIYKKLKMQYNTLINFKSIVVRIQIVKRVSSRILSVEILLLGSILQKRLKDINKTLLETKQKNIKKYIFSVSIYRV